MRIRRDAFDAICAHARRESPRECCGLLIGSGHDILEAVATANIAADPLRRYQVSPADHFAQIRRFREPPPEETSAGVIGAYHSHPRSAPRPSPTDLEEACEDFLYVIAGPADDSAPIEFRAYRLRAGAFEEVHLTVVAPDPQNRP